MTSVEAAGAEGGGARSQLYTGSDDEGEGDSSPILTDLASMFPAIDYNELVTILRSHGEDVDATVDYLMALSLHKETEGAIHQGLMMGEESYGRFSDEIGGPPEVLPSFMTGRQTDSDSDEAEEDAPSNHRGNVGSDEEDPLPSYEEAMQEGESYIVAGSIMLPTSAGDTQGPLMRRNLVGATANQPEQPHSNKKNKRPKKLRKLAGKLNIKKSRCVNYKAEQERNSGEAAYQPLLPPQVNGDNLQV